MAPEGQSRSGFYPPWSPHVFCALAPVLAVPRCSSISFLSDSASHTSCLSYFVHVTPSVEKTGTFPCTTPPTPQYLANLYSSFRSQQRYHPSILHYERSFSSYHSLQQKNCSSPGSLVPSIHLYRV